MLFPTHRAFMIHDSVRASLEAAFQDNWASIISTEQYTKERSESWRNNADKVFSYSTKDDD